jgi:uncharacterized membrane protein
MGKFTPHGNRAAGLYQPQTQQPPPSGGFFAKVGHSFQGETAMAFDRILIARILFTLMTIGWGVLTVVADFNATHATNPKWTPHARFHVVWQILSYVGFGLLAFVLIWWPGPLAVERLYLVALMGAIVYTAFFLALVAMPIYGGRAYDDNGYQPFNAPIPLIAKKWDANITAFSIQLLLLAAGVLTVTGVFVG